VNRSLPTRRMRKHPDLEQLKRQAKKLLRGFVAGEAEATAEVHSHYRDANSATFALHDAQLVLARAYGFESWPKLKAYVDGVTIRRLADAVRANDLTLVRRMLRARRELAGMAMSYGDEHRPIHFAVMQRSPEMVRLLMQHGASAREGIDPHRDATTAWVLARDRRFTEIVEIIEEEERRRGTLDEESEPAPEQPRGDEGARAAVERGDIEWLRARHAEGTLVNPVRWDGGGLLTMAVRHNRPEILSLLLDYGFDPDERTSEGEGDWVAYSQGFPLWNAAALGHRELAETLLARGADPNVHVDSSGSAVYSAYSHKQWEMVDLLRRHGGVVTADIAAIYRQTDVARQMLAEGQPVAEELLRHGAGGATEIVRMALEHIDWLRDDPRWFRPAAGPMYFWHHILWLYAGNREFDRTSYFECFRLILDRCGPNVPGSFGRTLLHEAAAMRDHISDAEAAPFARELLERGAKVDVRDDILKSTPLGWACRWKRASVARLLLEYGADPIEPDAESWATPKAWGLDSLVGPPSAFRL
jgi:ankyrin repeat protein